MKKSLRCLALIAAVMAGMPDVHAGAIHPVVLELFTSQGCSSCPPADALLRQLAIEDGTLLPLSFHVHYWDSLGWKDPFSSTANTRRQEEYAARSGDHQVYTPQLVVNGGASMVGSDEQAIRQAIRLAKAGPAEAEAVFESAAASDPSLKVTVSLTTTAVVPPAVDVLEVRFSRFAQTPVEHGENNGRLLSNINNVLSVKKLGSLEDRTATWHLDKPGDTNEGLAIIIQTKNQGPVLGFALYTPRPQSL